MRPLDKMESLAIKSQIESVCQLHLDYLHKQIPMITGALVSTKDGFEVTSNLAPGMSAARLAAMSSSLLSVADAMSESLQHETCRNVVVESDSGRIVVMEIPTRGLHLQMAVFCGSASNLGQILWPTRECTADLGRKLDALIIDVEQVESSLQSTMQG